MPGLRAPRDTPTPGGTRPRRPLSLRFWEAPEISRDAERGAARPDSETTLKGVVSVCLGLRSHAVVRQSRLVSPWSRSVSVSLLRPFIFQVFEIIVRNAPRIDQPHLVGPHVQHAFLCQRPQSAVERVLAAGRILRR